MREMDIVRVNKGLVEYCRDKIVDEFSLSLYLNGRNFVKLLCTPSALPALVYGYLLTERVIAAKDDIVSLEIKPVNEESSEAFVRLSRDVFTDMEENAPRTVTTGLGPQQSLTYVAAQKAAHIESDLRLTWRQVLRGIAQFDSTSEVFATTGGVHSCALSTTEGVCVFMEDIGRHNAFDKVLGQALLDGLDLSQCFLLCSGRVPGYMALKAINAGLPVIISRSAVTTKAVELARQADLTLCGFARGERVNIYAGQERIILPGQEG